MGTQHGHCKNCEYCEVSSYMHSVLGGPPKEVKYWVCHRYPLSQQKDEFDWCGEYKPADVARCERKEP